MPNSLTVIYVHSLSCRFFFSFAFQSISTFNLRNMALHVYGLDFLRAFHYMNMFRYTFNIIIILISESVLWLLPLLTFVAVATTTT